MKKSLLVMSFALVAGMLVGCNKGGNTSASQDPSVQVPPSSDQGPSASIPEVKTVTSIEIETVPTVTTFEYGDTFTVDGGEIRVYYSNDTSEVIPMTLSMVSTPNMETAGKQVITVTYEGKTDTFQITVKAAPVVKTNPTIVFSIENGYTITWDGISETPNVSVTVLEDVNYDVWFEQDEVVIGTTLPSTPGTYAIVIQTEENDLYNAVRDFRWFVIKAPTNKTTPTFSFTYESSEGTVALENATHFTEGQVPTFIVVANEDNVQVEVFYTKDDGETNLGSVAPTTPGTYAVNIRSIEDDNYEEAKEWRWYVIDPAPTAQQEYVHLVDDEVVFTYDGQPHTPIWHFENESGNRVEDVQYTVHYASETGYDSDDAPTQPGYYSISVYIIGDKYLMKGNHWIVFRIDVAKDTPLVDFTISNGDTIVYDGSNYSTIIGVLVEPSSVQYITYFEQDEVNIGTQMPTEPGTYSFICETIEDDTYAATRAWRWFTLVLADN